MANSQLESGSDSVYSSFDSQAASSAKAVSELDMSSYRTLQNSTASGATDGWFPTLEITGLDSESQAASTDASECTAESYETMTNTSPGGDPASPLTDAPIQTTPPPDKAPVIEIDPKDVEQAIPGPDGQPVQIEGLFDDVFSPPGDGPPIEIDPKDVEQAVPGPNGQPVQIEGLFDDAPVLPPQPRDPAEPLGPPKPDSIPEPAWFVPTAGPPEPLGPPAPEPLEEPEGPDDEEPEESFLGE